MYVVYQNHLSMMADYPAAYRGQPGLDFLVDVPANWDETRVLHAEFGRCIVIARRKGSDWWLGGMAAGEGRKLDLPLDFLGEGSFVAKLYLDDPSGGPNAITQQERNVARGESLSITMPASGGFAARVRPMGGRGSRRAGH
jgi:alpha-glucosidase